MNRSMSSTEASAIAPSTTPAHGFLERVDVIVRRITDRAPSNRVLLSVLAVSLSTFLVLAFTGGKPRGTLPSPDIQSPPSASAVGENRPAPATAAPLPDPTKVTVNDTYIKTLCQFTVTSANYAAGTVRGRLTAKTSWNGQAGFKNLAHVSINCALFNGDNNAPVGFISDEDDARATYETELVTVPLDTNYEICVSAFYTLRNGNLGFAGGCSPL